MDAAMPVSCMTFAKRALEAKIRKLFWANVAKETMNPDAIVSTTSRPLTRQRKMLTIGAVMRILTRKKMSTIIKIIANSNQNMRIPPQ